MNILSKLIGGVSSVLKKEFNPNVFSFLTGNEPPEMKGRAYLAAYKSWVYTCVNSIAEEIANMELMLFRKNAKGEAVPAPEHIAYKLINNVNNFTTSSQLMLGTQSYLELEGNTFWYLPKGKVTQKPGEIWLLDPTRMHIVKSAQEVVSGYVYQNEKGAMVPLESSEIVHFKRFNPLNRYRGMGTVAAAAMAIDADDFAGQWQRKFYFNSAIPSAVLETPNELTEDQFQRLKANWDSNYTGINNSHKLAILQGGLTYKPMQMTNKEMEFLESRKYSRDEIMAMFRVPKTILGISEDVNRANAEAGEYVFAKRVIKPRMQFVVDTLNEFYIPLFNEDPTKLYFDFEDPVPEDVDLENRTIESGLRSGWLTPNEARAERDLPPVENGDQVFISSLMLPLGETQESRSMKAIKKDVPIESLKAVESRVRWVNNEIKRQQPLYEKIYAEMHALAVAALGEQKSVTKGKTDDLVRLVFGALGPAFVDLQLQLEDTHKTAIQKAAENQIARLASQISFSLDNPRAVDFIRERGLMAVTSVNSTVTEEMRRRIAEGVAQGDGIGEITNSISEFFEAGNKFMAERIARTETAAAYAEGSYEVALSDDNVQDKRWLLTAGACEICQANEDEGAIPKDQPFNSGDQDVPAHPNCRCDVLYIPSTAKSEVYGRLLKETEAKLQEQAETIKAELTQEKQKAMDESSSILESAQKRAAELLTEAKAKAEAERGELLGDLRKLRAKALEQVYEKSE